MLLRTVSHRRAGAAGGGRRRGRCPAAACRRRWSSCGPRGRGCRTWRSSRAAPRCPGIDVLDQSAGVADLGAGLGGPADGVDRVARAVLVRRHAVGEAEDVGQVVLRVGCATVLALDGLPGALVRSVPGGLLVGPVDGLLEVPEVGEVEFLLAAGPGRESEAREGEQGGSGGNSGVCSVHGRKIAGFRDVPERFLRAFCDKFRWGVVPAWAGTGRRVGVASCVLPEWNPELRVRRSDRGQGGGSGGR
jgi:hypothetical protein